MNVVTYRGYGSNPLPEWMGGVPVESGGIPAQIQWRPVMRQVNNPDLFANLVQNIESAMAMGGLALTSSAQGDHITYYAGGRLVAEGIQLPGGFVGTIYAEPTGRLHMKQAAEQLYRSSKWLNGYGSGWKDQPGEVIAVKRNGQWGVWNRETFNRWQSQIRAHWNGYGQAPAEAPVEYPSADQLQAIIDAAMAATQRADTQAALAAQAQQYNNTLIAGFIGASAFAVVMWGLGQAVLSKGVIK